MRKLTLLIITLICAAFLAMNAFAGSLYKNGNIAIGGGYNSMALGGATFSGFNVQGSYFFSDDLALTLQYESLSGPATNTLSVFDAEIGWHFGFTDNIGMYLAVGGGSGTQTGVTSSISLTILEGGLEFKPMDHIVIGVGYKSDIDKAGTSVSGITGNVNFVF